MPNLTPKDAHYIRGMIAGLITGFARYTGGTSDFDRQQWREHYGEPIVYFNIPYYPSRKAARIRKGGKIITNWDESTETHFLKEGIDVPRDRDGLIVFDDGMVVMVNSGDPSMLTLPDSETDVIRELRRDFIETLREAQGYYDETNEGAFNQRE